MNPYEERIAEGWLPLALRTEDLILRVEDTGQLVNVSALKRRHDRECSYSRGGRLFLVGRTLCCQWRGCIVKRLREPEEINGPGGRAGKTGKTGRTPKHKGRAAPRQG